MAGDSLRLYIINIHSRRGLSRLINLILLNPIPVFVLRSGAPRRRHRHLGALADQACPNPRTELDHSVVGHVTELRA